MDLSKKIDTFTFRLKSKFTTDNYDLVCIQSTHESGDPNFEFYVYRSNSEGGIFRLCSRREDDGFEKGQNYVTTTFVHHDLQKFIIDNYRRINIVRITPDNCPRSFEKKRHLNNKTTLQYINKRYHEDKQFELFKEIGDCGNIFEHTLPILKNIFNIRERCDNDIAIRHINNFIRKINKMFDENRTFKYAPGKGSDFEQIKRNEDLNEKFQKYLEFWEKEIIRTPFNVDNKIVIFKMVINMMSNYFQNIFEIISDNKFLFNYNYTLPKARGISINCNIYSIKIRNKTTRSEFNVINMMYQINGVRKYDGHYGIILNIIPDPAIINRLGLYNKFLDIGGYICKIFDYNVQVPTVVVGTDVSRKVGDHYTFIGDIYKGQYPLNFYLFGVIFKNKVIEKYFDLTSGDINLENVDCQEKIYLEKIGADYRRSLDVKFSEIKKHRREMTSDKLGEKYFGILYELMYEFTELKLYGDYNIQLFKIIETIIELEKEYKKNKSKNEYIEMHRLVNKILMEMTKFNNRNPEYSIISSKLGELYTLANPR